MTRMLAKLGFFIVFLLLFQSLEAKKKKATSAATSISTYVKTVTDFLQDAWDALLDLLPRMPQSSSKKTTKKKNKTGNWDLNYYVKSATKHVDSLYKSVSNSMEMFRLSGSRRLQPDAKVEHAFSIELFAAEMLEDVTWGLMNIVNDFDTKID